MACRYIATFGWVVKQMFRFRGAAVRDCIDAFSQARDCAL
jgi:hypothetical protein